jgi:NADPH-dependent curcumin reductase CurA
VLQPQTLIKQLKIDIAQIKLEAIIFLLGAVAQSNDSNKKIVPNMRAIISEKKLSMNKYLRAPLTVLHIFLIHWKHLEYKQQLSSLLRILNKTKRKLNE